MVVATLPGWPAPVLTHVEGDAPGTTRRFDHLYALLDNDQLDRTALRQGLDGLARYLDDRFRRITDRRAARELVFADLADEIAADIADQVHRLIARTLHETRAAKP
jgi:hypothetical protein